MGMLAREDMFRKGSVKPKATGAVDTTTVTITITGKFVPFTVRLLDATSKTVQSKATSGKTVAFTGVAAGTYSAIVTDQNYNTAVVTGLVVA